MIVPTRALSVIQSLLVAHPSAITVEHCTRLAEIFDDDDNGTIEEDELLVKLEREDARTRKAEFPIADNPKVESKRKPAAKRVSKTGNSKK